MEQVKNIPTFTMPMRGLLMLSGIYMALWGAFFRWFGDAAFSWLAMETTPLSASGISGYGTLGIIAGILTFLAAFYPLSWIYLIAVGILGKTTTLIWFMTAYIGDLGWNKRTVFHVVFNEAIWLIPLCILLYKAWRVKKYLGNIKD